MKLNVRINSDICAHAWMRALELAARGVRVNSIHPGIIETPMVEAHTGKTTKRLLKTVARQSTPADCPHGPPGGLRLDESTYCTGSSVVVDGGHIAGPYRDPM